MVVSEAYAYGNSWKDEADHGDAVGITWKAIYSGSSSIPARVVRKNLMIKLCNQGIIPVTQIDGLVLCFPDGGNGSTESSRLEHEPCRLQASSIRRGGFFYGPGRTLMESRTEK